VTTRLRQVQGVVVAQRHCFWDGGNVASPASLLLTGDAVGGTDVTVVVPCLLLMRAQGLDEIGDDDDDDDDDSFASSSAAAWLATGVDPGLPFKA
jgi:hypothetical protein